MVRQPAQRARYYTIIPHATSQQVLVVPEMGGWSLPSFLLPEQHFSVVDHINQATRRQLGVETSVLRCLHYDADPETQTLQAVYALENHSPSWRPPAAVRWAAPAALDDQQRAFLETWLAATGGDVPASWLPWNRPQWFHKALAWMYAQLKRRQLGSIEAIKQVKTSAGSFVLWAQTAAGNFYFKAVPPAGAREPLLAQALSDRYPQHAPQVLTIDAQRHWILMREVDGTPLSLVGDSKRWQEALRIFADIQIDQVGRTASLRCLGCLDRGLDTLAAQIEPLFTAASTVLASASNRLTPTETAALRALAPGYRSLCARLARYDLPLTLEHGDFHPHNISVTNTSYVYLDWYEGSIGHPFFSPATIFGYIEHLLPDMRAALPQLRQAYLEPWTSYAPMDRLLEAFELARPLATLQYALSLYQVILDRQDQGPWETLDMKAALAVCLRSLLQPNALAIEIAQ